MYPIVVINNTYQMVKWFTSNMKISKNLQLKECSVSFANKLVSHNLHQV